MKITKELIGELPKFDPTMNLNARIPEFYLEEKSVLTRLLKGRDIEKIKEINIISNIVGRRNAPPLIMDAFIESLYVRSLAKNDLLDIDIKIGDFWAVIDGLEMRMQSSVSDVMYKAVKTDNNIVVHTSRFEPHFSGIEYVFTVEDFIKDMYVPYSGERARYITDDNGNLLEQYIVKDTQRVEKYLVYNQFKRVSKEITYRINTEKEEETERSEVDYKYDNDGKLLFIDDTINFKYSNDRLMAIKSYGTFQTKYEYLNTVELPITAIYEDKDYTEESLRYRFDVKGRQ